MKPTCIMRQLSQLLRTSYEVGFEHCKEVINEKLAEFKEVRCKRQGAKDNEIHLEFQEIASAALEFEYTFFERKLEATEKEKVEKDAVDHQLAKIAKIKLMIECIQTLLLFVFQNLSSGQCSGQ